MGIEYLDVTPYNFIEKDGTVYIIDFGHARNVSDYLDDYLDDIFANWKLKWNPEFA
jgi:tRNA A-37 threonylcarbamoyl transferase component Bud32